MSVAPFLLTRPVYTLTNSLVVPLSTVDADGMPTARAIITFVLPIHILLDSFMDDLENGRSYSEEQAGVYATVASKLTGQFGIDGHACILRFMCELQQRPIGHWTLAGHLLTLLFTPHVGEKDGDVELLKEHLAARILGKKKEVDCGSLYSSCPFSAFYYFESLRNTTASFSSDA